MKFTKSNFGFPYLFSDSFENVDVENTSIICIHVGGKQPDSLMVANVTIISHTDCQKVRRENMQGNKKD